MTADVPVRERPEQSVARGWRPADAGPPRLVLHGPAQHAGVVPGSGEAHLHRRTFGNLWSHLHRISATGCGDCTPSGTESPRSAQELGNDGPPWHRAGAAVPLVVLVPLRGQDETSDTGPPRRRAPGRSRPSQPQPPTRAVGKHPGGRRPADGRAVSGQQHDGIRAAVPTGSTRWSYTPGRGSGKVSPRCAPPWRLAGPAPAGDETAMLEIPPVCSSEPSRSSPARLTPTPDAHRVRAGARMSHRPFGAIRRFATDVASGAYLLDRRWAVTPLAEGRAASHRQSKPLGDADSQGFLSVPALNVFTSRATYCPRSAVPTATRRPPAEGARAAPPRRTPSSCSGAAPRSPISSSRPAGSPAWS